MKIAIYLTVVATTALCLGVVTHAVADTVSLDLRASAAADHVSDTPSWLSGQAAPALSSLLNTLTSREPVRAERGRDMALIGELAAGFGSLVFEYASSATAQLDVYEGTEGTGRVLASVRLAPTGEAQAGPRWRQQQIGFAGTARSFVLRAAAGAVQLAQLRFEKLAMAQPRLAHAGEGPSGAELVLIGVGALLAAPRRETGYRIGRKPV